jgi:uncharacterized phage protein gp47/JayE
MPLLIPSRQNVVDSLRNYVRGELPTLDPSTQRRSFVGGLVKALGSALEDWYIALKRWADREPWPQFATENGSLLTGWWIPLTKLQRLPPAPAAGFVAVAGISGTVIPTGTLFQGSNTTYASQLSATIVGQPFLASTLTYDGGTGLATFTTANPHFMGTGLNITVVGADQVAFNGNFVITVTDDNAFTYQPLGAPVATPATGSVIATSTFAAVEIEATTTGQSTNSDSGATLSIDSTPAGANATAYVTFGGIGGGADLESIDSFRARILQALGVDYGMFTADEISIVAKQVPGVTRVFVRKAEVYPVTDGGYPVEGQVKIAFLRDNDANPLPTTQEVADVKNRIVSLLMPAHTALDDVIVMSPPPFPVDFTFTSITPDTPGMRRSIQAALAQYFKEEAPWGGTITIDDYRCVIRTAFDFETRQSLKSFSLSTPVADIVAGSTPDYDYDDMAVLGTLTFP